MKLIETLPANGKKIENWKYENTILFKVFFETYDYWNWGKRKRNEYLVDNIPTNLDFQKYNFENIFVEITDYLNPELIDSVYIPRLIDIEEEWERGLIEQQMIPIAVNSSSNDYLLLGIGEENTDKIYYTSRSFCKIEQIADHIFEYFSKIEVIADTSYSLPKLNVLYKNWNEDFWRVREEGDASKIIEQKNLEIAEIKKEKEKFYYRLKALAREEKKNGVALAVISDKYNFSIEELEKPYF